MKPNTNVITLKNEENENGIEETLSKLKNEEWKNTGTINGVIYKTTNLINNKIYIGKDKYNNPNYLGSGLLLNKAMKLYGKENFKKEILEKCNTLVILNEKETYWIKTLNSTDRTIGYNIATGGLGGDTFSKKTDEEKEIYRKNISYVVNTKIKRTENYKNRGPKISKSKKGCKFSEEHRKKLSESHKGQTPANKGKKFPEMSKNRIGKLNPMFGKTTSDKQKQAVKNACIKRWNKYREDIAKKIAKV